MIELTDEQKELKREWLVDIKRDQLARRIEMKEYHYRRAFRSLTKQMENKKHVSIYINREKGKTFRACGEIVGLSKSYVSQIYYSICQNKRLLEQA